MEKMRRTEALLQARNLGEVGRARGVLWFWGGGVGGSLNGDKVLRAGVGTWSFQAASGFCSANGNPGLNSPSLSRLPAHLPSGQHIHAGVNVLEGLVFLQELRKETLALS